MLFSPQQFWSVCFTAGSIINEFPLTVSNSVRSVSTVKT